MEEWTTIRYLKAQGLGTWSIAKHLGISRNKVKRALFWDRQPQCKRQRGPISSLDPLKDDILQMLVQKHFIGSRIIKELRKQGYSGSKSAFYDYLARIKAEEGKTKACIRYETAPGQQAQFDWSPYTMLIGSSLIKVVIFRFILGFSRHKCHFASLNESQLSVFEGIEHGLWKCGGAPKELVLDSAVVFVHKAAPAHFEWNRRFLSFP